MHVHVLRCLEAQTSPTEQEAMLKRSLEHKAKLPERNSMEGCSKQTLDAAHVRVEAS